jgi:hypothetical protein
MKLKLKKDGVVTAKAELTGEVVEEISLEAEEGQGQDEEDIKGFKDFEGQDEEEDLKGQNARSRSRVKCKVKVKKISKGQDG